MLRSGATTEMKRVQRRLSEEEVEFRSVDAVHALEKKPGEDTFPFLLKMYRERARYSGVGLSKKVGVDPSYLNRIEAGDRPAPLRDVTIALASALRLSPAERDRFVFAAGYTPDSVRKLGRWDDALAACAEVLTDDRISIEERSQFRTLVVLLSSKWGAVD